jgi:alpha-tubulin suppressor-like RCC1 family protein
MRLAEAILRGRAMMPGMRRTVLGALLLCGAFATQAYEPKTHETITAASLGISRLAQDPEVLKDLGVDPGQKFSNGRLFSKRSIPELLQDGAGFEDSFPRPANHFYDPENDKGAQLFEKSPDWAIDGKGDLDTFKFSFRAARDYLLLALTDRSPSFREDQFGLMFRSLGQVIHHLQDMAQPQHTRLDLHCDILPCALIGKWAPSLYEKYTDSIRGSLKLDGYEPVYSQQDTQTFNSARRFWHTPVGEGIADYSNRGFVSAGTNFDKPGPYTSPAFDPAQQDPQQIQELCAAEAARGRRCPNPNLTGSILFFGTTVEDKLRPSATTLNKRTTSLSLFDHDLTKAGGTRVFTLNRFNFYAAHDLLIPRATAYSAGLINYFFRGKIDYARDPADPSRRVIKNLGPEPMAGVFALYYDDAELRRHEVLDSQNNPVKWDTRVLLASADGALAPGASMPANSDFVPPADAREANVYMLVFNGDMGEEKPDDGQGLRGAVVGKLVKPELPRVSAGAGHSLVIRSDGTLLAFGENSSGEVGNGSFSFFPELGVASPHAVAGVAELVAVAGGHHTLALRKDGSMQVWGNNRFGELGLGPGSPNATNLPQPMSVPGPGKVVAVAGGWLSSYALKDDGSVWAWGDNSRGQVGDGGFTNRNIPVKVMEGVAALARGATSSHMLALKRDGSVWAWGVNISGQLGDGSITSSSPFSKPTPVPVRGLPAGVVALAAGGDHSLALTSGGTVYAWGRNDFNSSLGVGLGGQFVVTAAPVQGLTGVKAIAAGDGHSLALREDGTVWAWGLGGVGQLGNPQFPTVVSTPAQVEGPTGIVQVAAGELHSLAIQANGDLWTWGYNFRGQLGDGGFIEEEPFGRAEPRKLLIGGD